VAVRLLAHKPQPTRGHVGPLQDAACLDRTLRSVRCERFGFCVARVLTQHGPKRLRNDAVTVDSNGYLSVSDKSNGKWLYYGDTYNLDRPLPQAGVESEKK